MEELVPTTENYRECSLCSECYYDGCGGAIHTHQRGMWCKGICEQCGKEGLIYWGFQTHKIRINFKPLQLEWPKNICTFTKNE